MAKGAEEKYLSDEGALIALRTGMAQADQYEAQASATMMSGILNAAAAFGQAYAFNKSLGAAPKTPLELACKQRSQANGRATKIQTTGRLIPSIPTVDFTATGRAQAGVFESVSRGLDVMSRYVASQAEARTKLEAAQWAYDRDLTAEQLTAALESGQSVDQILGDPTTVFGSVSIATTADKLSADLTADARMRLADLSAGIDGGADLDINSEMAEINSLSAGYADLLSTLDPKVASSFSASVATLSAPVYQKGLERQIKLAQSVKMAGAEATMAALPGLLEDLFEADRGSVVIGSDMLVSEGQAATAIEAVSKELLRTNDAAFFTEQTGKFPEMIATAKINVLSNYAVELPAQKRMSALRTGNFW